MTDSTLSEKRRRAGRRGAAARWGNRDEASNPHIKTARPVAKLRQGRDDWYRVENKAADGPAEVFIYDEIGYFGVTAADFVADLQNVNAEQIRLHINSPGGDVFDALVVYNAIRDHPAEVEVVVDGIAASSASWIAQAGDRVVMNRGSQLMIHDAWSLTVGNAQSMRQAAEFLDKQSSNIAGIYAERAGGTVDEWRAAMSAETWYTADEAVDAGLADEVAGRNAETKNSFDLSVFTYAGRDSAPEPVIPESAPETPATPEPEPTKPDGAELARLFASAVKERAA
jgi:ATP-dependent protease ClpP protease subunit